MSNKRLSTTITIGGAVTAGFRAAIGSTTKQLRGIGTAIGDLNRAQRKLGEGISVFGRMGKNVDGLRARYAATVRTVEQLRVAQTRLAAAQARSDRIGEAAGKMKKAGVGATLAGGAMIGAMVPGVQEAKHYQNEKARITALGMGDKVNAQAFEFAKDMKTFGTSQLENLELLRDGMSVFADLHHAEMVAPLMAKMKFGNKAVFGQEKGEENAAQFMDMLKVIETRGGLKSEAEFTKQANIIQQVISATGGRVGATEWRHMLSTGGLAGKGMDSEALFYTMEHLVQEMGGDRAGTGLNSMYKSLYQGTGKAQSVKNLDKLGLIGDKSKVINHDKTGVSTRIEPGALLGADLFRANPFDWMNKVLLPQLAKKGITGEKQVIDTIGTIVSNSVGGSFLAEMYRQRENIERARGRNKNAQNIDQLYSQGKESATGKEQDALAKFADAKKSLGDNVLPMYTQALITASEALKGFNEFAEKHGTLVKFAAVAIAGLGVALVTLGPVLTVAAAGMSMYAAVQLRMAAASAAATTALARETAAMEAQNVVGAAGGGVGSKLGKFAGKAAGVFAFSALALEGAKMAGLPDVTDDTQKQGEQELRDGKWLKASTHMGAGSFLKGLFTGAPPAPAEPTVPAMRGAGADAAGTGATTNNFNITQQPGQDSRALADEVARRIEQQNAVKRRSGLTDGTQ